MSSREHQRKRRAHFHFHLCLTLLFALFAVGFSMGDKNQTVRYITADRRALIDFKKGLIFEGKLLTNHVVMLELQGKDIEDNFNGGWIGIGGEIGTSLLEILEFIGSLTNLTYLNLSYNSLTGFISHQVGNLSRLLYLDLSGYQSLRFDNLEWLSRILRRLILQSLVHFNSSNSLSIFHLIRPSTFHHLAFPLLLNISQNLVKLDLSYSYFTSLIPNTFDNMPLLNALVSRVLVFETKLSKQSQKLVHKDLLIIVAAVFSYSSFNILVLCLFLSRSAFFFVDPFNMALLLAMLTQGIWSKPVFGLWMTRPFTKSAELVSPSCSIRLGPEGINLEGGILQTLGNLYTLKELNLQENNLNRPLTVAVKNLSGCAKDSLEVLKLGFNHFNGSLPSFVPFSSLRELDVGYNQLSGHFKNNFRNFSKLSVLNLSSVSLNENRFTGPLPDLSRLSSLRELSLRGKLFEGPLHLSIGKMSKLELLDVTNNSLHGVISEAHLSNLTKLQFLSISFNALSFHPSSDWNPPFQLYFIGLTSCELGPQFPNLFLNLCFNQISGRVPNLPLKFDSFPLMDLSFNLFYEKDNYLSYLNLSNNLLSAVIIINLENNNLSGVIPNSLGSINQLGSLHLRNTSLYGEIPQSLEYCTQLKLLDLGENKLTRSIPSWIGKRLESLIVLRLRSNKFHGGIPSTLCHLQFLQVLDLSLNNISRSIPSCLNNLTTIANLGSLIATIVLGYVYPDIYDINSNIVKHGGFFDDHLLVIWKGVEQEYQRTLGLLKSIDLSSNKLSGEIPQEIASLQGLITLNLSRNTLSGCIIREIGQLKAMESLFSFDATSYSGNPRLCETSLKKCPRDELPKSPKNSNVENRSGSDEGLFEPLWFFTGMATGFFVGFWGAFVSLLINRSLRHGYFQLVNKLGNWIRLSLQRRL
ncbi:hypothetical protein E1A91_A07G099200v1 [Gossypium mustelinum]|uniref:Leucine-rich repeat-containing N-terminal plant-type domain-containing protein n=1 Tax=Gossypium mustelinum TaxID=34275 RepID=A0A5D2YID4_GOSMU|nr:hypothetical protein E1A91_A07G099200v1 [Gossypium mustelinum]